MRGGGDGAGRGEEVAEGRWPVEGTMRGGGEVAGGGEEVAEGGWLGEEGCAAEGRRWRREGRRWREGGEEVAEGRSPAQGSMGGGEVAGGGWRRGWLDVRCARVT